MKKLSLIALGIGGACIVSGLAMSSFNVSRIKHDLQAISHKSYTTKSASFAAQPVRTIKTDLSNVSVTIKENTTSDKVSVDYFESKKDKFAVTDTNGTVLVSRLDTKNMSDAICLFRCIDTPGKIVINVPVHSSFAYDITANNTTVRFKNSTILHATSVRVQSSNGSVQLKRLTTTGNIEIQSDNGSSTLRDVTAAGNINLHSSNGGDQLDNVTAETITARGNNAKVALQHVATNNLTAQTSNGSITFEHLKADHITAISDNSIIRGSIAGSRVDYKARVTANNGNVTIDNHKYDSIYFLDGTQQKSLSATSSNGSISINFGDSL